MEYRTGGNWTHRSSEVDWESPVASDEFCSLLNRLAATLEPVEAAVSHCADRFVTVTRDASSEHRSERSHELPERARPPAELASLAKCLTGFLDSLALFVANTLPVEAQRGLRCESFELLVDSARKTLHMNTSSFELRRVLADRGSRYETRFVPLLEPDAPCGGQRVPQPEEALNELRALATEIVDAVLAARLAAHGLH